MFSADTKHPSWYRRILNAERERERGEGERIVRGEASSKSTFPRPHLIPPLPRSLSSSLPSLSLFAFIFPDSDPFLLPRSEPHPSPLRPLSFTTASSSVLAHLFRPPSSPPYPSTCFPPFSLARHTPPFSGTLANHSSYPTPFGYLHTPLTRAQDVLRAYARGICKHTDKVAAIIFLVYLHRDRNFADPSAAYKAYKAWKETCSCGSSRERETFNERVSFDYSAVAVRMQSLILLREKSCHCLCYFISAKR